MNNAAKHAGANKIRVELEEDDAQVKVRISDDGRGFDVSQESEGFGLIGMRERVEGAGGELSVESDLGSGTVVTALLPVARRGEPVA
jgi:signal transduction histidine kinase